MELYHEWSLGDDLLVDHHLQPFDANTDLGPRFGLPRLTDHNVRKCSNAMLLSAIKAASQGYVGFRYSRDRNRYHGQACRFPAFFTLENIKRAAAHLALATNFFQHEQQRPTVSASYKSPKPQSRFCFLPDFVASDFSDLFDPMATERRQRIILKDAHGKEKALPLNDPILFETNAFLDIYDEAIDAVEMAVDHPSLTPLQVDGAYLSRLKGRNRRILCSQRRLTRVFSRSMRGCGRWFHGWWMLLPAHQRAKILINGEPVDEYDYSSCHLRLALAAYGQTYPLNEDPYKCFATGCHSRKHVKLAINVMFNAPSIRSAIRATVAGIGREPSSETIRDVGALMTQIVERFPKLQSLFYSRIGLRLMFIESEIMRHNLADLLSEDIVALPIHDSAIALARHHDRLRHVMESNFEMHGTALAKQYLPTQSTIDPLVRQEEIAAVVGKLTSGQVDPPKRISRVVKPPGHIKGRRVLNEQDRAKVMAWAQGRIPRLIGIEGIEPWHGSGMSRSAWYSANQTQYERQTAALSELTGRGDEPSRQQLGTIISKIADAKALVERLPDDRGKPAKILIEQLEQVLADREAFSRDPQERDPDTRETE